MVERSVCSTGEETETVRSSSGANCKIETRNDDFGRLERAEKLEKLRNCEISREPEIAKIIEASRAVTNRESGIATGTGRFSLFKWLKRGSRDSASSSSSSLCDPCEHKKSSKVKGQKVQNRPKSVKIDEDEVPSDLSSNESVETLYSTATVRSFAFRSGTLTRNDDVTRPDDDFSNKIKSPFLHVDNTGRSVGPFGVGAAKLTRLSYNYTDDVTKTLPANVLSKRRDITARYSLQPCTSHSGGFGSCGNFCSQRDNLGGTLRRLEGRGGRVHVKGKRRAPTPPVGPTKSVNIEEQITKISRTNGRRKRRPAPKPPDTNFPKSINFANSGTNNETGSNNFSSIEETASLSDKRETGSFTLSINEKIVRANLSAKEETGSANFLAEEETGSADFLAREETGSADFLAKEEPGSANFLAREETGSADFLAREETGSANLLAKEKTGSAILLAKEGTGSADILAKKETGSADFLSKEETGSADFLAKEGTGNAKFLAKEETGSAKFLAREETGSAHFLAKEETGSADFLAKGETGSADFLAKEETGSADFLAKKETGSADFLAKKETGSAHFLAKEKTGSAILLAKEETGSANFLAKKETGSANFLAKEETGSANLQANEETGCENGMRIGEANSEDKISKKLNKEEKGIVTRIPENICCNSERTRLRIDGNFTHDNTKNHEKFIPEELKNKNNDFVRSSKTLEDVTNFIPSTDTEKINTILLKNNTEDISNSISNDSLVLQGGVLHSKREINFPVASSSLILATSEIEKTNNRAGPKGRISITTGSQTSVSAMPRPWYKRNVFEHSRDSGTSKRSGDILRNPTQPEVRNENLTIVTSSSSTSSSSGTSKSRNCEKNQDGGTLSRLNFFHRGEKINDEKKKDNKRKSGISILTNISELDKEAAAIVQEEQAKTRAASMLLKASRTTNDETTNDDETEDLVQNILTSAVESSSPRRGTRALISKFNAIGNITKVTVNTSFFHKNSYPREPEVVKNEISISSKGTESRSTERENFSKSDNCRVDKDLSKYFLPVDKKISRNIKIGENSRDGMKNSKADISARLTFFQGITGEKKNISENALENKITRLNEEIVSRDEKSHKNSPKFSRLRVNVPDEHIDEKSRQHELINEKIKKIFVNDDTRKEINENAGMQNCEIVQKEFSNIFKEIDGKFDTGEKIGKKIETPSSTKVSKVLDILVEAEKNDRQKINLPRYNREREFIENFEKLEKDKILETIENPATRDLKEMLKEMKHSLPKRPKDKKKSSEEILMKNDKELSDKKLNLTQQDDKKKELILLDDKKSDNSHLLSHVTVAYPPPIRIGPPCDKIEKTIFRANEEKDSDRQKVSSAAQTSGNVRKVNRQRDPRHGQSSKWKNEDIVYKTSGKGCAPTSTSGLTKNTFQLIRPREFAQIEAIKTMKNSTAENTYANVIEQSLYANALVPTNKKIIPEISQNKELREGINLLEEKKLRIKEREIIERETMAHQDTKIAEQPNMNTLAVNRLLRKLEAAIASGHHQQAAGLAKELARLKIHCSVVRQRTKAKDVVNVNMYIEDKLAHQGPIPLRLAQSMTVAQLKTKIFTEFEIPTNVQRWIVGKNLADEDSTTLEELQAVEGSPVFLYLVAPELKNDELPLRDEKIISPAEHETSKNLDPEPIDEITKLAKLEESDEEAAESQIAKEEDEEEFISEEVRMERYEALISLENCDVIPNSEPIECPICFVTYGPQEGVILRDCLHMFCRPCIANTIRYCDEAEVKCPYRDTEYTCESTLQEREIKALVEPQIYQQHLAKSIAQAENNAGNNSFHCKTPDCPGWCIYDDNVNNFLCPVCSVNNCLTCQVVHTGKNCRQYQEELRLSKETDQESKRTAAMLEDMVDRGEALPCPTCAVVLMKKWGCDWLRCSMCKTEICWVTRGPRWGPGGKGDTSGGCRCGENGVKCHPRCNYCH